MLPKVLACNLIVRQWGQTGLIETAKTFASLDELYAYCLTASDDEIADRIVIHGKNENGQVCELTFVFQSITVAPPLKP